MSCDEHWSGKLKKVDLEGRTVIEMMEKLLNDRNMKITEIDNYEDEVTDLFYDIFYNDYVVSYGEMYRFEGECSDSVEGTVITKIGDGEYSFTSSFYNGGTCISEQLTEGLEIKKREEIVK